MLDIWEIMIRSQFCCICNRFTRWDCAPIVNVLQLHNVYGNYLQWFRVCAILLVYRELTASINQSNEKSHQLAMQHEQNDITIASLKHVRFCGCTMAIKTSKLANRKTTKKSKLSIGPRSRPVGSTFGLQGQDFLSNLNFGSVRSGWSEPRLGIGDREVWLLWRVWV